jgi:DNA repair exonuclease SbcCD ATPase subunit
MGWKDTLAQIPKLLVDAVALANDVSRVQRNVEGLQEQSHNIAETLAKHDANVQHLSNDAKQIPALLDKLNKLETEIASIKTLQEANDRAHFQQIEIDKLKLEKYISEQIKQAEGRLDAKFEALKVELKDALREAVIQARTQQPQAHSPLPLPQLPPQESVDGKPPGSRPPTIA